MHRLPPPDTVEQALARSLQHARNSASQALLATRALMDALSILLADEPVVRHAQANSPIANVAEAIERWADTLQGPEPNHSSSGLPAVLHALEAEIDRWEMRAQSDSNARTVLHAFLGIRDILWEFSPPANLAMAREGRRPSPKPRRARNPAMNVCTNNANR
ncbi:MAG TPA: hypothetical protein EYQ54_06905 [Myxococcales bacterium]|nr:hypothetical protein [Myxococcales bacterium]HIL81375.1 hypothetical protein [Myxococcales bacterium]